MVSRSKTGHATRQYKYLLQVPVWSRGVKQITLLVGTNTCCRFQRYEKSACLRRWLSYADSLWFMGRYNPITASTTAVTTIVTNYSNNKIYSLYNSSCSYYKYSYNQRLLLLPRSGELRTQKLKSHLVRTQSLNVLPLKPGVGEYIAIHATLTARDFFLLISTLPVHSPAFVPKPLPIFSCFGCG